MINNRIKRFLSMLMCMVVMVTSPCTSVFAYTDYSTEEVIDDNDETTVSEYASAEDMAEEDLFTSYMLQEAEMLMDDTDEEQCINEDAADVYVARGSFLAGNEKYCYDYLSDIVKQIASGKRSDTVVYIPFPDELQKEYTAEMLGISKIYDNGNISDEAKAAMEALQAIDRRNIVRCLLTDMPYELYWYDKVKGFTYTKTCYNLTAKKLNGNDTIQYSPSQADAPAWKLSFSVAEAYRSDINERFLFDTELANKATAAAAKAAEDVRSVTESVSSDYAKLKAYQRMIQSYSAYNNEAVSTSDYPYGDPWQMIYVFDEDPSTTVVCEGFSKAFKFMCDLSSFAGDIDCYLVSGFLNGPSGNHMWNNVRMEDGKVYLVDVTNSRAENAKNFLGGAIFRNDKYFNKTTTADGTYTTYAYSCGSLYYYDKFTMNLYDDDDLTYTTVSYNKTDSKPTCNITLSMNYEEGGRKTVSVYKNEDSRSKILNITAQREGYSFAGWYTAAEGGDAVADKDKLVVSDNNTVLYAHWDLLPRYNVTAHSGTGVFPDGSKSLTKEMYEGKSYYDTFGVPENNGHYDFTGWYEDESLSSNSLIKDKAVFDTSRSRDIYAGWKIKRYKLTMYPNGGEFYDGVTKGKVVTYNAMSRLSDPEKYIPVRSGYNFDGWFTQREGGEEYDISKPIEGSIILYAHWSLITEPEVISDNKTDTPSENKAEPDYDSVSVNGFYATFADEDMYKDEKGAWHAVYTGDKLTPSVRVYDNRQLLTEGVDYSLKYVNNTKAYEVSKATAYVQIKGKGNLKGTYKLHFIIDRRSLQDAGIGNLCVKEGNEDKADPAVMYNGRLLKKDKDYRFEVKGNTVNICGIGNFSVETSAALEVLNASEYAAKTIKAKLKLPKIVYDGSEKFLKDGSELIVNDKTGRSAAYSVSYSDNVNAGVVKIVICGINGYHGVIRKSFRIKPCRVSGTDAFEIKYDKNVVYKKGGAKATVIRVSCNLTGEVLKEGRDMKYTYASHKKAGTAKLKISFKGNYRGSSYPVLKYTVEKRNLADAEVYTGDIAYTVPKKYKPKVIVTCDGSIVSPKEYTTDYIERSKISETKYDLPVSVTASEKNFTGYAGSVSYNIVTSGTDINNAKIIFTDGARTQYYEGHGEAVRLIPGDDFKIRINKDLIIERGGEIEKAFDIIYADNTSKGTATMILIPKNGRFIGVAKTTFKIKAAEINSLVE